MTDKKWSAQQVSIFDWFIGGDGNLVVRARAGTGKTTTIVEAVTRFLAKSSDKVLLAAFNKKIAVELNDRLPVGAEAKTLHSLGFGFVRSHWNNTKIDDRNARSWSISEMAAPGAPDDVRKEVCKLSAKLKSMMPMAGADQSKLADEVDDVVGIADRFGINMDEEFEDDGYTVTYLAKAAIKMLMIGATHRDGTIDFDDMVWLPVRNQWARPRFDLVVIDEAQDMNATQIELAMSVCRPSGRIAVVGDDRQAIYGFRGADSKSIDRLLVALEAKEMGLNTTYRCGKTIVREAKRLVPDFIAHDSNQHGVVRKTNIGLAIGEAQYGDFILSRTNAPLVSVCLKLLRDGKRANIEGKDVGRGLAAIVKKLNKGPARSSFAKFLLRLDVWLKDGVAKAALRGEKGEATMAKIIDQHATLSYLAEGLASADELMSRIDSLFADTKGEGNRVILSSVHKSKGLESDRVWLLEDTFFSRSPDCPKWADKSEEANIEYVAVTRAKAELVWVEGTL